MKKALKNQSGFTLIELMIVVAIIGILAAVAIPQYQNFTKKSKASEAKVILDAIVTAEAAYFAEKDNMTDALADLGNPESPAKYYDYTPAGTGSTTTVTASPNGTGTDAGLESDWTMTYNGTTGVKDTGFPSKGF
jgi:type IV pilus assembly protein PilA